MSTTYNPKNKSKNKVKYERDLENTTNTKLVVSFDISEKDEVPKKRPIRNIKGSKGQVISVKDGVAYVSGLRFVKVGEMVSLGKHALLGMALNLENEVVGCIIFGDDTLVGQGDTVSSLGSLVRTPVGGHLLGRVVNGLGKFIDSHPNTIINPHTLPIERKAPGVITRESVTEPMLTGYKIIDSMLPIGRGQREILQIQ